VVFYLLAANLFLNTPLGSWALNRRPQMLKVTWDSAWSLYPGDVRIRGLKLRGGTRTVTWSVDIDRGRGRIDLPALLHKELRVAGFIGEGGQSVTVRTPPPPGKRPPPPKRAEGQGWTIRIENISVSRVRSLGYNGFRLEGEEGQVAGGFSYTTRGGPFELDRTTLRMPEGRLSLNGAPVARGLDTDGEIRIEPYRRQEHPGIEGWGFISGRLQAKGEVPELPILAALGDPGRGGAGGATTLDVRVERGVFASDSRFTFRAPRQGDLEPFAVDAAVSAPGGPGLVVRGSSSGIALGRRKEGPPLLRTGAVRVVATTPELRVPRLFGVVRQLRPGSRIAEGALAGEVQVEGLAIHSTGGRVSWRMEIDRGTGRLDLGALLRREVLLEGVRAEGLTGQVDLAAPEPPAGTTSPPWSVALADAQVTAIREIGFEDFRLSGQGEASLDLVYTGGGEISLNAAGLAIRSGRLLAGESVAAEGLAVKTRLGIAPFVPGTVSQAEFLRLLSGTVEVEGRIASLGFLERYFARTSWLRIQGQGRLDTDIRLQEGRLLPGTRLAVRASRLEARVLDVLATGSASLQGTVRDPDAELSVAFDRFAVAPGAGKNPSPYLRGRGLRVTVLSKDLDLTTPVSDLRARVDLANGEVPDLSAYNDFLPAGAGVSIVSGAGKVRLGLSLDAAKQTGQGTATFSSDAAAFRFQDLTVAGRLGVRGVISTSDLESRRFKLAGSNITLNGVTYEEAEDWWAKIELTDGSMLWKKPLALSGTVRMKMKSADPILALFAQKKQYLEWFRDLVNIEDITAGGNLRLDGDVLEVAPLQVLGNRFDLRSRLRFSRAGAQGDLYVRYRRLSVGVELDKGKRDFKLRRPLEWYEGRSGGP
jgi:hypothetical protein